MRKTPRRAFLDEAGRLYVLKRELDDLRRQREALDDRISRLENRVAEAERGFDASYDRLAGSGPSDGTPPEAVAEAFLTPGKLPSRVLECMRQAPARIYTAADLQEDLGVSDVQQVRTALARLVGKGLVRRAGAKGEFTI